MSSKFKLTLIVAGSVIATWLIFELFFYATSLGYVSIGDSYCKFGPIPAKYASFDVAFKSKYTGQLTLIDKNGKQLSDADYTVLVNGKTVGTSFKAPGKTIVNIKIRGNSNKVSGRTFVRVKGGGPFITHYYFRHHSNPLVYYLVFIITAILFVIILWYVFLQRVFFPRFKNLTKTIIIPNQAPLIVRCKGYREIVLSNTGKKQGVWDKLIKGPILYKVSPAFEEVLRFKPTHKGKKILVVGTNSYKCTPNPIDGNRPAMLENISNKQKITIN